MMLLEQTWHLMEEGSSCSFMNTFFAVTDVGWMDTADSLVWMMCCLHLSIAMVGFNRNAMQMPQNLLKTADFQPGYVCSCHKFNAAANRLF